MKKRCSTHSVLNVISYSEFKQDMVDFVEKLHHVPEPFLIKVITEPCWILSSSKLKDNCLSNVKLQAFIYKSARLYIVVINVYLILVISNILNKIRT